MTRQTTKRMVAVVAVLLVLAVSTVRWMPVSASAGGYISRTAVGRLYYNHFDSLDGTIKAGGGTWTLDAANSLLRHNAPATGFAYVDVGVNDYVVDIKFRRSARSGAGGCGGAERYVDNNNYYYVEEDAAGNLFKIKKTAGGVSSTLAQAPFALAANTWYVTSARFTGNMKDVYVAQWSGNLGNHLSVSSDSAFPTGGKVGLRAAPASGQHDDFDYLVVYRSWTIAMNGLPDGSYFKIKKGGSTYQSSAATGGSSTLDITTFADRPPYDEIEVYDSGSNLILDNQFSNDVYGGDVYNFGGSTTTSTTTATSTPTSTSTSTSTTYGFTWAWMTDTQHYAEHPEWAWIYSNMTTWVTRNAISYVIHTGDVVQNGGNEVEYQRAKQSMDILTSAGVPYGVLAGNHDGSTLFQKYFGDINRYNLASYGGVDFIIVYLSYGIDSSEIAWANSVFGQYPSSFGILAIHEYLNTDGSFSGDGSTLYNQIVVPNQNVRMVLCGHNHGYWLNTKSIGGRTVYEALGDPQDIGTGGDGWFNILQFDVPRNQIHLQSYSSMLKTYGSYDYILNVNFNSVSTTTTATSSTPSTSSTTSSSTSTDPTVSTTSTVTSPATTTQVTFSTVTTTSYVPTTVTSTVTSTLPGTTTTVTNTQTSTVTLPGTTTTVTVSAKYKIQVTGITILQAAPGQITVRIDYKSIAQEPITRGLRKGELTLAQGDPAAPIAVVSSDPIYLPTYGSAETVTFPFSSDQILSGKTYVVRIFLWSQSPTGSGDWEAYTPEAELGVTI